MYKYKADRAREGSDSINWRLDICEKLKLTVQTVGSVLGLHCPHMTYEMRHAKEGLRIYADSRTIRSACAFAHSDLRATLSAFL